MIKKLGVIWASVLLAMAASACTVSLNGGESSKEESSSDSPSEPIITEETIFDFEGNDPLKGGDWYTQQYEDVQLMEEIVEIDGNRVLKITPKLNSWAGIIANPFIGLGSAVTQFKITITSQKEIEGLRFEVEYDRYLWTSTTVDVQIGTHEYVLEYEQPIQFLFGFSVKANPNVYSELYLDNLRSVKVIN